MRLGAGRRRGDQIDVHDRIGRLAERAFIAQERGRLARDQPDGFVGSLDEELGDGTSGWMRNLSESTLRPAMSMRCAPTWVTVTLTLRGLGVIPTALSSIVPPAGRCSRMALMGSMKAMPAQVLPGSTSIFSSQCSFLSKCLPVA